MATLKPGEMVRARRAGAQPTGEPAPTGTRVPGSPAGGKGVPPVLKEWSDVVKLVNKDPNTHLPLLLPALASFVQAVREGTGENPNTQGPARPAGVQGPPPTQPAPMGPAGAPGPMGPGPGAPRGVPATQA